jgi:hypothetical protein
MLDHHHRVATRRQRSPGHDSHRLTAPDRAARSFRPIARLNLACDLESRRDAHQVLGSHRVSIAGCPGKGRKVAIRHNFLG